jgi:hypothetical protein
VPDLIKRSPYLAAALPIVALAAGVVRWFLQGSGNVYTATDKRFFLADRDLGWRAVDSGSLWLGLEALAGIAGVAAAAIVAAWIIGRVERRRGRSWGLARVALWAVAALPLALPAYAFATGGRPADARDELPEGATAGAPTDGQGIEGSLPVPAGTYAPLAHQGTSITAKVTAGKETFDARFPSGIEGQWTVDPRDLRAPMKAELSVATAVVDTGISLRSQHAREEYLQAEKFPKLGFRLERVIAARQDAPDLIAFRGAGTVLMMGKEHPVEITGTLRALDDAGRKRLGIDAAAAIVAQADFALTISETALAPDKGDFDGDRLPIHASLVLVPQP